MMILKRLKYVLLVCTVITFSCKVSPIPLSINFDVEDNWKSFRSMGKNVTVLNDGDTIWVGTTRGLWTTSLNEGVLTKPVLVNNIPSSTVRDIKMDASGIIWVATYSGVYQIINQEINKFNTEDGLLQNSTNEFEIDHQGRIWAVSSKGASLFDGRKWKTTDAVNAINNSNILQIEAFAPGADNSQYFAANNGLWQLKEDGQWKQFTINDGLTSNEIKDVHVDKSGKVWVSYKGYTEYPMTPRSFGVSVFDGSDWNYYDFETDGSCATGAKTIESDPDGNIWFVKGSLCRFDGDSWISSPSPILFYNDKISIDVHSEIWTAEQHSLLHCDGISFTEYALPTAGILSDDVYDITVSEDGSLWFATAEGVSRYKNDIWENFDDSVLDLEYVRAIDVDKLGVIWAGGRRGAAQYNGQNWQKISGIGNHVYAIHAAEDGRIWIGSFDGLHEFDGQQWIKHDFIPNIMDITTDLDGVLWMATETGGICKYDGQNFTFFNTAQGLTTRNTYSIFADSDSCIWVGTAEDICKYDRSAYHYSHKVFDTFALANPGIVKCIYKDDSGKFYFGTSNTVATYAEHWGTISVNDDLINNNVRAIEVDNHGNIWFATAAGISRYSPEK